MKSNNFLLTIISILLLGTLYILYTNSQQIQTLRQENTDLYTKIDSVLQICRELSQQPVTTETVSAPQSIGNSLLDYLIKFGEDDDTPVNRRSEKKIVVNTKYRIEDRYVQHEIKKPEFKGNQVGNVVISILVNWLGDVNSVKLKSATGITDEEVIEACKKAALKTQFNNDPNYNYDKKQPGTITYTFSTK